MKLRFRGRMDQRKWLYVEKKRAALLVYVRAVGPMYKGSTGNGTSEPVLKKNSEMTSTKLRELPFVAKDLGDEGLAVHELRDVFRLSAMKILHFAFSFNITQLDYIPHNHGLGVLHFPEDLSNSEKYSL